MAHMFALEPARTIHARAADPVRYEALRRDVVERLAQAGVASDELADALTADALTHFERDVEERLWPVERERDDARDGLEKAEDDLRDLRREVREHAEEAIEILEDVNGDHELAVEVLRALMREAGS